MIIFKFYVIIKIMTISFVIWKRIKFILCHLCEGNLDGKDSLVKHRVTKR